MATRLVIVLVLAAFIQGRGHHVPVPVKEQKFLTEGIENRIINGEDAEEGQFPYQVGMFMDKASFCGGSIISKDWVLTAAHCVDEIRLFTIFLGALNMNLPIEPGRIVLNTRTAHMHEGFDRNMLDNDVGVVKLSMDIQPNGQINIISLPPRSFNDRDFTGQPVRVSGWGKLSDDSRWISSKLQFVDLTVISNEQCEENYRGLITDKIVCATGPDQKGTCQGDSGGPLVIKDQNNKTIHFAVVSFVSGFGCASGAPSGYDRTSKFLDWIHEKTGIPIED